MSGGSVASDRIQWMQKTRSLRLLAVTEFVLYADAVPLWLRLSSVVAVGIYDPATTVNSYVA